MLVIFALEKREKLKTEYIHRRAHFAYSIGLSPKARGQKLAGIPTVNLPKLQEEYPPAGKDIYESEAIHQIWKNYRKTKPYPDSRGDWKPYYKLDPTRLQYTVEEDKSVIIRDSKSGEIVCMVIQNFSNNEGGILEWVNGVIKKNTEVRKSVRVSFFLRIILLATNDYFS